MTLSVIEFPNHTLRLEKTLVTSPSEALPEEMEVFVVELENTNLDPKAHRVRQVELSSSLSDALFTMGRFARTLEQS